MVFVLEVMDDEFEFIAGNDTFKLPRDQWLSGPIDGAAELITSETVRGAGNLFLRSQGFDTEELDESLDESGSDSGAETDPIAPSMVEHAGNPYGLGKGSFQMSFGLGKGMGSMLPAFGAGKGKGYMFPLNGSKVGDAEARPLEREYSDESASESSSSSSKEEMKQESSKPQKRKRAKSEPLSKKKRKKGNGACNKADFQFENAKEKFQGFFELRNEHLYKDTHPEFVPMYDFILMKGGRGTTLEFEKLWKRITTKVKGGVKPIIRFEYQPSRPKGDSALAKAKRLAYDAALETLTARASGDRLSKTFDTMAEAAMAYDAFFRLYTAELLKVGSASIKPKLKEFARETMQNIQFPTKPEVQKYGVSFFKDKNTQSCHLRRIQSDGANMVNKCMEVDKDCKNRGCALGCLHASCDVFDVKKGRWAYRSPNTATKKPHFECKSKLEKFFVNSDWQSFEIIHDDNGVPIKAEVLRLNFMPSVSKDGKISKGLVTVLGSDTLMTENKRGIQKEEKVTRCDLTGRWCLQAKELTKSLTKSTLTFSRSYRAVRSTGTKMTTRWTPKNKKKRKRTGAARSVKRQRLSFNPASIEQDRQLLLDLNIEGVLEMEQAEIVRLANEEREKMLLSKKRSSH